MTSQQLLHFAQPDLFLQPTGQQLSVLGARLPGTTPNPRTLRTHSPDHLADGGVLRLLADLTTHLLGCLDVPADRLPVQTGPP
jgi:hypothetical protein